VTREVDFYELKRTRRMIAGIDYAYYKLDQMPPQWLPGGEMAVDKSTVQEERVPIHHVRAAGKNKYIAIAPELRELLEAPFEAKVLDAQSDARARAEEAKACRERLIGFNASPWYVRVWRAFAGPRL
jgi:hypothetical protein